MQTDPPPIVEQQGHTHPGTDLRLEQDARYLLLQHKPPLAPFDKEWLADVRQLVSLGLDCHKFHQAIDLSAPYGSTVYAAADGMVRYANWGEDGLGYTVIIDHGDGLETLYVHLKGVLVQADTFVTRGDAVGEVGSTGHSTGPHIHFEVRLNDQPVNPLDYLPIGQPQ